MKYEVGKFYRTAYHNSIWYIISEDNCWVNWVYAVSSESYIGHSPCRYTDDDKVTILPPEQYPGYPCSICNKYCKQSCMFK